MSIQARRIIFGLQVDINQNRRYIEGQNWNYVEVVFKIWFLKVFFIAISGIKQAWRLIFGM